MMTFQSWKDQAQKSALERPELPSLLPRVASQPQARGPVWDGPVSNLLRPLPCKAEHSLQVLKGQPPAPGFF